MLNGVERIRSVLEEVALLLKQEEAAAARSLLEEIRREPLQGDLLEQADFLHARILLLERNFGLVQAWLSSMSQQVTSESQRKEIELLDAYAKALSGQARRGFARVVPLLRGCSPLEDFHARAAHVAGLCLYRAGHYRWARSQMQKAVAYYRLANDAFELSRMLNSLALVEKGAAQVNVALGYFDEACRILPAGKYLRHRRRLLTNRGVCFLRLGRPKEARVCLLEARSLNQNGKDLFVEVSIGNNLGHALRIHGDYDAARESYLAALADARNTSSLRQEVLSLEFLGELFLETGDLSRAGDYLRRAYEKAMQLAPHGDLMMEVLRRRGELHAALGRRAEAEADLERAIQLCRSRGEERERILATRALVLVRGRGSEFANGVQQVLSDLKGIEDRFEFVRTIHVVLKQGHLELLHHAWFQESVAIATYYADAIDVDIWKARLRDVIGHSREIVRRRPAPASWQGELFVETRSRAYSKCLEAVRLAARSDSAALIVGETGSGKEVIARLVHDQSSRTAAALVAINCGALPENLVESELFGHARGTFTGAHRDKEGLFEAAGAGTVLLDEIGDLPIQTQVKLLRFLDSGEFRRVGETRIRQVDVRVLAATNRDLRARVESGQFREDLFFRLNVFQIDVPPLRNRREDILPLAQFFMHQASRPGMELGFTTEVENALLHHDWPGNIRELKNLCEYLTVKVWGRSVVAIEDLPSSLSEIAHVTPSSKFERERVDLEKEQIIEALRRSDGKILRAARLLRMSRNTLAAKMREFGLKRESFMS